jgi:hypothetical protein
MQVLVAGASGFVGRHVERGFFLCCSSVIAQRCPALGRRDGLLCLLKSRGRSSQIVLAAIPPNRQDDLDD